MSEGLQKLKEIGAQKIYEQTHIPVEHVQAILYESFEGLHKVQFVGFISILEREYGVDLSNTKYKGITHFEDHQDTQETKKSMFIVENKKSKAKVYYIIALIFVLIFGLWIYSSTTNKMTSQEIIEDNDTLIADVPIVLDEVKIQTDEANVTEQNTTITTNVVKEQVVTAENNATTVVQPEVKQESFAIEAKKRVWIGYIDLDSYKKKQKVFSGKLELDPKKRWLITTGHGFVNVTINGEEKTFKRSRGLKFYYHEGVLKEISYKEFKRLNRGRAW